jgi:hypothetical protein
MLRYHIFAPYALFVLEDPLKSIYMYTKILNETTLNMWYCNLEVQDRDIWRAVVNTVMNLWVPYNEGNFF